MAARVWKEPRFDSKASIRHWRELMASVLCVEASYIEDWEVEQFMREMAVTRERVAGQRPDGPPPIELAHSA